jgi:hypothetical protein
MPLLMLPLVAMFGATGVPASDSQAAIGLALDDFHRAAAAADETRYFGHGDLAWFDETLGSAKYGACRGIGVLKRVDGKWLLAQYSLTFLVPNTLAEQVTKITRGVAPASQTVAPASMPATQLK